MEKFRVSNSDIKIKKKIFDQYFSFSNSNCTIKLEILVLFKYKEK